MSEPECWMFQHEETGAMHYVDQWQIDNGFEKTNPRLQKICPLYRRHTPDDMVQVPRKPTSAMMNMFWIACQDIDFDTDGGFEFAYKAMIEATK